MRSILEKREWEKRVVLQMIWLYCRKQHNTRGELCKECIELSGYTRERSDNCPFMNSKSFCSNCRVHCYQPTMREKIKNVMRFSGPRMIFYHPLTAIHHLIESKKENRNV